MTGVTVQPQGSGDAFRAAGFQPGDVVVGINGQPIRSADSARAMIDLATQAGSENNIVQVERNGRPVSLRVRAGQ
jgi:general secretion pathway protein C